MLGNMDVNHMSVCQEESMRTRRASNWLIVIAMMFVTVFCNTSKGWCDDDLNAILKKADEMFQAGKYKQAEKLYHNSLRNVNLEDSQKDLIYFRMGQCADKTSKSELAKYYYKQAMNYGFPAEPDTVLAPSISTAMAEYEKLQSAYAAYSDSVYVNAEKIVLQLLTQQLHKKDRLEPLFLLGRAQVCMKEEEKAKASFKDVLKIDSHYEPLAAAEAERNIFNEERKNFNKLTNKAFRLVTNKWTWIGVGGTAAVGGVIYWITTIIDGEEELPGPPELP